ncbi:MAG: hypothetical protein ACC656_13040 [Candidatus Heimdallarchaeota archaeon]
MELNNFKKLKARSIDYDTIRNANNHSVLYPYILDLKGDKDLFIVSPYHGRSAITKYNSESEDYCIIKGCGLTYYPGNFINTREYGDHTWGLLLVEDAIRDFDCCLDIQSLNIITSIPDYVIELKMKIELLSSHKVLQPALLQSRVRCPYRICDFKFVDSSILDKLFDHWDDYGVDNNPERYLIAADLLIKNLSILHNNDILHNAIHIQNYTLLLELIDFELSRTPNNKYRSKEDEMQYKNLMNREIIQTLEIVNYISWITKEKINKRKIQKILEKYEYMSLLNSFRLM